MVLTFGDAFIYVGCYFGLFTAIYFILALYDNRHDLKDQKLAYFPFVTIAVPAYNEEKTLKKTLKSLLELDYPSDKFEIIVVDDGSKDNTLKIAKKFAKKYAHIFVIHQKNQGKGVALNSAIKKARGDFFGCLDADSFVDPLALQYIISRFSDVKTMAVTPSMKVYNAKGMLQYLQDVEYILGVFLRKVFAFLGSIHVTPGPFSFFRMSFFNKYGGYDENNPTEDIELALRIQAKGYHIENALDAFVYTVAPNKFMPLLKQRLRWYHGFLLNVQRYLHLFSVKNGNLGLIMLPSAIFSFVLSIFGLCYAFFTFGRGGFNTLETIFNLKWNYFELLTFNFDVFRMGNNVTFLLIFTLAVSIFMITIAHKLSGRNDRIVQKFIVFSLLYWFFYGIWWILAIYYRVTGNKIKWGARSL